MQKTTSQTHSSHKASGSLNQLVLLSSQETESELGKVLKTLIEKELEKVRELRVESLETSTNLYTGHVHLHGRRMRPNPQNTKSTLCVRKVHD
jgi:hypothetical protein